MSVISPHKIHWTVSRRWILRPPGMVRVPNFLSLLCGRPSLRERALRNISRNDPSKKLLSPSFIYLFFTQHHLLPSTRPHQQHTVWRKYHTQQSFWCIDSNVHGSFIPLSSALTTTLATHSHRHFHHLSSINNEKVRRRIFIWRMRSLYAQFRRVKV